MARDFRPIANEYFPSKHLRYKRPGNDDNFLPWAAFFFVLKRISRKATRKFFFSIKKSHFVCNVQIEEEKKTIKGELV